MTDPSLQGLPLKTESRSDAPLLRITGLRKRFGGVEALRGLDLTVTQGSVLGIVGPNGAGKSTLFDLLTGVTPPDSGSVLFDGRDVTRRRVAAHARLSIARTFQQPRLVGGHTCLENVLVACTAGQGGLWSLLTGRHPSGADVERSLRALSLCGVGDRAAALPVLLTPAEQRFVEIARAIVSQPQLLLLDEPTAGMTVSEASALEHLLVQMNREAGTTLMIVSHTLRFLSSLVQRTDGRILVLHMGEPLALGTPDEVFSNDHVRRAYVGGA